MTLAIVLLLSAITFPHLVTFYSQSKNQSSLQNFITQLQNAHFLAVTQHVNIGITQQQDKLITFLDLNNDGSVTSAAQKISMISLQERDEIKWRTFPSYRNYILFTPSGADNGSFWYCTNGKPVWEVVMNNAGRLRVSKDYVLEKCE